MRSSAVIVVVVMLGLVAVPVEADVGPVSIERVSLDESGGELDQGSLSGSVDGDGSVVVFSSSSVVVAGDGNGRADVWARDRSAGTMERVSVAADGGDTDADSLRADVDGSGRWVVFESDASNLVAGDTNGVRDIFVRDRELGVTSLVSVAADGGLANGRSENGELSADGRWVVFESDASNLVAGDTNGVWDVFVRDLVVGVTVRVSLYPDGSQLPFGRASDSTISADGSTVAFTAPGERFGSGTQVYVADVGTGVSTLVTTAGDGIDPDGPGRGGANPFLSPEGDLVGYQQQPDGPNTTRVLFVYDRGEQETAPLFTLADGTTGNDDTTDGRFSDNGRYVVFSSQSTDLSPAPFVREAVFRYDLWTDEIVLASIRPDGSQGDRPTVEGRISGDGAVIAFEGAANLISDDPENRRRDVFVVTLGSVDPCERAVATVSGSRVIVGTEGDDVIFGSAAADMIDGRGGDDLICGFGGDDDLRGGPGADVIIGGPGNDRVRGDAGADTLDGGPGTDDHTGGADDDTMIWNPGDDRYRGGPGIDTVDYHNAPGPVIVRLDDAANDGPAGEVDDVWTSIEDVRGSAFDDLIVGSDNNNRLDGFGGDDIVRGSGGNDLIIGGPGDDTVRGGPGDDTLRGERGDDRVIGGPGNDTLTGGPGIDYCRGSAGFDTYFRCETADP